MNELYLICFDMETTGLCPFKNDCCELAAQVYHPRTLCPISKENGGQFYSMMKPTHPENIDPKALACNKKTVDQIMAAPDQAVVWNQFVDWVMKWNTKKSKWGAPIALGKNIRDFDLRFVDVMNQLHCPKKEKTVLFNTRRQIDLEDFIFHWWNDSNEMPNEKMDTLREYFGLKLAEGEQAHSAQTDVRETGELIMRFLKLYKDLKTRKSADGNPLIKFKK